MAGYSVDLDRLSKLVGDLEHAADDITAANRALGNAGSRDLGSPGIDAAGEEFQQRWSDSISKISEGAKVTSEALDGARGTYAKLEEQISQMVKPADGGGDPPAGQGGSGGAEPSNIEQRLSG